MKDLLFLLCLLLVAGPIRTQQGWTEEARQYLLDNLNRTTAELEKEVAGLSESQWHFREKPDSWSVAQVIEHLGIYERKYYDERYLLSLMPPEPESPDPSIRHRAPRTVPPLWIPAACPGPDPGHCVCPV